MSGRLNVGNVSEARGLRRLLGFMGRRSISGVPLWFPHCASVHTCFMRARIDVIFLDRSRRIVRIFESVPAWRFLWGGSQADSVLEFAAGCARMYEMSEDDQVEWQSA